MNMTLGPRLTINCPHCKQPQHAPNCPRRKLEELTARQRFLECPACGKNQVDANSQDFWECRSCNTQFSRSGLTVDQIEECTETKLVIDLDAHWKVGIVTVLQMKTKGQGKFPTDQAIKKVMQHLKKHKGKT